MKDQIGSDRMLWHKSLTAMNLILPVLEIVAIGEVILQLGSHAKSAIGLLSYQKLSGWRRPSTSPQQPIT
ncbi:MAG: hypothetical protein JST85_20980 [Acidobacteria bacterium]|nr:hypothetical protein [Acidobacteriota bacterium]